MSQKIIVKLLFNYDNRRCWIDVGQCFSSLHCQICRKAERAMKGSWNMNKNDYLFLNIYSIYTHVYIKETPCEVHGMYMRDFDVRTMNQSL